MSNNNSIKHGLSLILKGMIETTLATATLINKAVHAQPWIFIILTTITFAVISVCSIYNARAERDKYNNSLVELQLKYDSLKAATNYQ